MSRSQGYILQVNVCELSTLETFQFLYYKKEWDYHFKYLNGRIVKSNLMGEMVINIMWTL